MTCIKEMREPQAALNRQYAMWLLDVINRPSVFSLTPRKRTRMERIRNRIADFAERCRDAWLVLKGEAHIADEDY